MYQANKKLVILFVFATLLTLPVVVLAYPGIVNLDNAVNNILSVVLGLFSVFAVIMLLFAGFLFLSARGEQSKVAQAKQALFWGIAGVVVGLLAFGAITEIRRILGV